MRGAVLKLVMCGREAKKQRQECDITNRGHSKTTRQYKQPQDYDVQLAGLQFNDDDDDDCRFVKCITQDASTALHVPVRCEEVSFQR